MIISMKKIAYLFIFCTMLFFSQSVKAQHLEIDLYGLSYHLIGYGYEDAPRKLNDNGAWVFNPGVGITYDFRDTYTTNGFSGIGITGYFQDCDDRPYYFYGGGTRYRQSLSNDLIFDFNAALIFSTAQDWETSTFNTVFMPLANIGMSRPFFNRWWTLRMTYVPENTGISATTGTDILFMNLSVSFDTIN